MRTKNLKTAAITNKWVIALFIFAMAFFIPAELYAQVGWEEPPSCPLQTYYGSQITAAGADTLFITQGGGGSQFYKYTISSRTYTSVTGSPWGIPSYGSMCWGGGDFIYATQGDGATGFQKYSISGNAWSPCAAIPVAVSAGSDVVYVSSNNRIYCLIGNGTAFYYYDIGSNTWSGAQAVALGAVNTGGALAYPGSGDYIYALRGANTTDFWRYSISGNSWGALTVSPTAVTTEGDLIFGSDPDYVYAYCTNWPSNGFKKYRISTTTWSDMANVPISTAGGADIVYVPGTDWFYFNQGNWGYTVLRYSISNNRWGAIPAAPNTITAGGSLSYYGSGNYIYALRGSTTADFWRYDTSAGTWNTGLAQPTGTIGAGGAICSDGTNLFVMAGNSTSNFWKYTVGSNSWSTMTSTPGTVTTGGFLLYPGTGDFIYAFRGGSFSSFWRYSISGNSWSQLALTPNVVEAGASLSYPGTGDYIYALRGAATSEFWRYSISGNTWSVLASTPATIGSGGALIYPKYGNYLYATRGQNTAEFYRYNMTTNTWATMGSSPFTFNNVGISLTFANDYIYCFAGNTTASFFRYKVFESSTPTAEAIFPNEGGTAGGTTVKIIGKNFYPTATVTIGGVAAVNVAFLDTGLISAAAPAGVAGAANVVVTNPGPLSNTLTGGFTYKTDPIVKSVSPYSGSYTGGTNATITGENFAVGVTVKFGANSATNVVRVSSTSITCATPAGTGNTWSVDLTVTNPGPFNGSLKTAFRYVSVDGWDTPACAPNWFNDGSAMAYDGADTIYALRGDNTTTLWKYSLSTNVWTVCATTPGGTLLYRASSMCFANGDYIYVFRGNQTGIFWRYKISTDTWNDVDPQDTTVLNATYLADYGCSMAWLGGDYIYATLGTHASISANRKLLLRYSISGNTWAQLASTPNEQEGGCDLVWPGQGDYLYATRGANTTDFWRYSIAGNTWETLPSTPNTIRYGGSLAWAYGTNYFYLLRGNATSSGAYFYRYSMGLNSWETMQPQPMSYNWEGGTLLSISNSDYLYSMPAYYQRDFVRYSVSRNNWVDVAPAPASIAEGGNILYDGSANLYVCGGASTTNFWKYTTATDTWATLAAIPATVNYGADMVLAGTDKIYLMRGTATTTFYRYTISTNTWDTMTALPNTASYGAGLAYVSSANAIYCARASSSSDFYKYDITSNSWSVMSSLSATLNYGGGLHYPGTGDFMYMFGSNGQQTFYKYSISLNAWTQLANAPSTFGYYPQMVYAGFGDKIYATGANYGPSSTTNHAWWYYSTTTNAWTTLTNTPFKYYQVTDFARVNDYIYSLVGNNTPYITKYCVLDSGATPSISLINPSTGPTSGNSPVSITGTGFYPGLTLTFGGQAATNIVFNSSISLTVTIPAGSAGAANVVITNPNTKTSTLVGGFTYDSKPYLTSATPQILVASGGTPITITGANFVSGATVSVGGVSATGVLVVDPFTITCTAPSGLAIASLTVANPDLQNATLTNYFEFEAVNSWNEMALLPVNAYQGLTLCYPGTGDFTYFWPYPGSSSAFYKYSFTSNAYTLLTPVTTTGGIGADMVYVPSTTALYLTRGGGTSTFYRYNIGPNTWDTMTACTSNVTTGGFLVYPGSGDFIYCAPGGNTNTFLRYSISGNSWLAMTNFTATFNYGASGNYPGSGDFIYVTHNNTNTYYRYSISGNSWLQMANMPFSTYYGAYQAYGNDGYIYCTQGSNTTGFARYNITGNSWTSLTATPVGVYQCGKMAYIASLNAIMLIPAQSTQYVFKYYLASQKWSKLTPIPSSMSYGNICGTTDKKIYVMYGQGGTNFYKYDITANTATTMTATPWGTYYGSSLTQVDSTYLYALRGYGSSSFAKFNMTTNVWTSLTDAPTIVGYGADSVYPGTGDYIYATGGGGTLYFWRYVISQNKWESLATTPFVVNDGGALCYSNGKIYLSVGNSQTGFYSYDIASNTWLIESSVPFAETSGFDMAWPGYGDVIYALQGNTTTGFWGYYKTTKSWVSLSSAPYTYSTGGFLTYGNDNYLYAINGGGGLYFARYRLLFEGLTPSITTVFPTTIPVNGGMTIVIYGSNFTPTTTVKFGAINATSVTFINSTRLEVVVPAGVLGLSDITVSNGSLTYTSSNAVTFVSKPYVTSITPEEGVSAGKSSVTIKGYNFVNGATVTIGGTSATSVAFVNSQTLTCLTPAGTAWAASVTVTNPDVQTATLRAAFRYIQANVWTEPALLPAVMSTGGRAQWDGNDTIYYTNGNNSTTFSKYIISTNTHSTLAVTLGTISTGSVLLYPGSGDIIYCARANNTATFWGYSISGNSWNDASYADAPVNLSAGASAVRVGTKLYFFQGNTQSEFMTYDTGTNTWDNTTPASAPATVTDGGYLAYPGSGDYIYAFHGSTTADFWRYSISGNTWTVLASAPGNVVAGGYLQFHNSDSEYLYAFQGNGNQSFWRYSLINQNWQATSYPPNTISTNATLVSIGNSDYIYAFRAANTQELWRFSTSRLSWNSISQTNFTAGTGGDSEIAGSSIYALRGASTSYFNAYDISTNTWKFLASTPAAIATAGAIAYPGTGDYLYAARCSNTTDFYRYSISLNTWTSMAPVPGLVNTGAAMTATGTYVYLLQGSVNDFWRYTIATNSWDVRTPITNVPGNGADMAYPGTGDYIYVLRGSGVNEFWRYSISGDSWLARANLPGTVNIGGSLACTGTGDYIFAVAGNGSLGYYRYTISLNTWDDASAADLGYFYDGASLNYYNGSIFAIAGSSNTNYSFWRYTVSTPITVVSVSPNQGPSTGGTNVTVTGTNFIDNPATTVTFGGVLATNIIVVNALTITCTAPSGAAGNATVTVTVPGPQSASLTNGFTYFTDPAPSVTSAAPSASDIAGGASVAISGTNFVSGCSVFFGTTSISGVTFVSSSSLTFTAPAKSAGTYDIKVVNPDTQYNILTNGFVYANSPTVSSIAPNTGTSDGGDSVTITGTNFVSGATVKIGANSATGVTVVNSTSITCTTPSGTIGGVNVVVTNPSTLAGTLTNGFTFQPVAMPNIISIAPDNGDVAGNTPCTITGTDFKNGATVFFGANPALLVTWVDSTSITCSSPAGSIGAVPVKVVNPDTQYDLLFNGFTYNAPPAPQITSITPDNGLMAGGTSCTIAGNNFNSGVTVFFGANAAASVVRVDANTITCSSPAGNAGAVSIKVVNTDAQYYILFNGYTYNSLPVPQITSVSPDNGFVTGGTSCTISGSNFNSGVAVFFGANAASNVTRVDSNTITCFSPAGNAGTVTIKAVNTDTQYGLLTNGFTYNALPSPQITSVSPTHGPIAGGTSLTISGNNFSNGLIVKIGPNNATSVTVVNSSTITCLTPAVAVASTVNVTVTNPDSQAVTLTAGFSYDLSTAPAIALISPASGVSSGGTSITVSGYNFQNGLTLKIGSSSATSVTVVSTSAVTAVTPNGTLGQANVTITNPDGQSYTSQNGFTYISPPTITSIAPNNGSVAGNIFFTITGTNFESGSTITFGGSPATGVTFVSSTVFTGYTPSGYTGKVNVVITSPSQAAVTLANGYEYTGAVPAANAGSDKTSDPSVITLDGTKSTNTTGTKTGIIYQWSQVSGPEVVLNSSSTSTPSFTGKATGEYVFQLIIKEGAISSAPDSVTIKINNVSPVAVISNEKTTTVTEGDLVTLDAGGSYDANGDALTYNWTFHPNLDSTATDKPVFDTTGLSGVFNFSLVVSDGINLSSPADVTIAVQDTNMPPLACAGPDRNAVTGTTVYLDGSTSRDDDGNIKTYLWQYLSGPSETLTLNSSNGAIAAFVPATTGVYYFSLDVTDDDNAPGMTSYVSVYANSPSNHMPSAVITTSATRYTLGQTVTLDAGFSSDPDNDALTYKWELLQTENALSGSQAGTDKILSFTAAETGTLIYKLSVNDGTAWGVPDEITIYVVPQTADEFPVAEAFVSPETDPDGDSIVNMYDMPVVTLIGYTSTGAGSLSFLWQQKTGISVTLDDAASSAPKFAPPARGLYEFQLTVTDQNSVQAYDNVTVIIDDFDSVLNPQGNNLPVANAGDSISTKPGKQVALDGSGSYDSDTDSDGVAGYSNGLLFSWTQLEGPVIELYNADTPEPSFTPTVNGNYKFKLTVSDAVDYSAVSYVTVVVTNKTTQPDPGTGGQDPVVTPDPVTPNPQVSDNSSDSGSKLTQPACFVTQMASQDNRASYIYMLLTLLGLVAVLLFRRQ
ncbi:MAG: IPT/TIG domain-containing protein [Planctomycetes bacterium]|nr:IPT/TIG domain-containing protein [Planctomycetota bacterium]